MAADHNDAMESLDARIARLAAALREREQLEPRRAGIVAAITTVTGELAALRRAEAAEQRDVDRLEGFTVDRVLTTLRGAHGSSLERERAEAEDARARTADAQRRLEQLEAQLSEVRARLIATNTAPASYAAALAEKERLMPGSGRLAELAAERKRLRADLERLQRAGTAAARAAEALREASDHLASAGNWSLADTFLGGGVLSSYAKHERMDEAAAFVSGAERQLEVLRRELGGRGPAGPVAPELGLDETSRLFDVWLDNIFTDLGVQDRIRAGHERIGRTTQQIRDVRGAINARLVTVRTRLTEIEAERERLLVEVDETR
jgi:DNA repair exonuclease SbcCD ATPase subunit